MPLIRVNGSKGFIELYMSKLDGMKSIYVCMSEDGLDNPACDENFHHGDSDKYLYFERCYRDIAAAAFTGEASRLDFAHGELTQQILLAIYTSAQSGKRVIMDGTQADPVFRFS